MKWLLKFGKILLYPALFVLGIYFFSSDALTNLFSGGSADGKGILVRIAMYFKGADIFNLFFFVITFGLGITGFVLLSLGLDWIFKRIGRKYQRLNFINADWADIAIQIPLAFGILFGLFIAFSNILIPMRGDKLRISSTDEIESPTPVFVLGTSKYLRSSTPENPKINLYYQYRMDAAIDLWNAGKVKYFILSGDGVGEGHKEKYDETEDMTKDLLVKGVPTEKIKIDRFGFNTQNSIIRLKGVFKLNSIVLVSQNFQNVRAALMSEYYGIKAMSYDAKGSATRNMFFKEVLQSRPKLVIDLLFLNMQPEVTSLTTIVDGKEVVIEGDYKTHEEFDATKSDRHVWTIIIFIAAVVIIISGITVYIGKKGEERRRFAVKLSLMTFGISAVLFFLVIGIYKVVPNSFVDEIVESVAEAVGVKTDKMEIKQELELKTPKELFVKKDSVVETVPKSVEVVVEKVEEKPNESFFNTVSNPVVKKEAIQNTQSEAVEKKVEEDLFNTVTNDVETASPVTAVKRTNTLNFIRARIQVSEVVANEGTVLLKLEEPVVIDGVSIPKNFIFETTAFIQNDRYILQADKIGKAVVDIRNYDGGREGNKITDRNQGKKGTVVLSEGEIITLAF